MIWQICNRYKSLCILVTCVAFPIWADGGKFLNPITDICWKCIFPIHIAGVNVTPGHKESTPYKTAICACAGTPPKVGIPLAFWEPVAFVDVTRTPFKSLLLGGISFSSSGVRGQGGLSHVGESSRHSFYNVHYYKFPVLGILGLLPGFSCLEKSLDIDISYLSELDPQWSDDSWSQVFNPEAFIFSNPLSQTACIADCTSSTLDEPLDKLFWCAGCAGSLYPLMGHVSHHVGSIQASHLLVHRTLSKLHSLGMMWGAEEGNFCEKKLFPRIKKSIYKTQLVQPIANTEAPCHSLGKSDLIWGSGKSYPHRGEDFVYLIWSKKHCCLDSVKATTILNGGSL